VFAFGVNPSKAKYPKIREPSERGLLNLLKSRQRNLFWILVGFNKFSILIKLFLFTKRNSFWRQINRKSVITIQIWIDLTRFRTDFSLKSLTLRCIFYRIFLIILIEYAYNKYLYCIFYEFKYV